MNAYLIAAKANAWEVDQHVGHAIVANQPEYEVDALGRGAGTARTRFPARPRIPLRESS